MKQSYTLTKEVDLPIILDELKDKPDCAYAIKLVRAMDTKDKAYIWANPEVFRILVNDMESGEYQDIAYIVDTEKFKGRLTDMSFLKAYIHVKEVITEGKNIHIYCNKIGVDEINLTKMSADEIMNLSYMSNK